ncbi:hypothetical protein ACFLUQ_02235 [Chloroflexota bacterium]
MALSTGDLFLGQLSIDPALAKLYDEGNIDLYYGEIVAKAGESLLQIV